MRHARINYANGDMVGHTGNLDAAVIAVEAVDLSLARIIPVIEKLDGALIVTADHGNCDEMFEVDTKSGDFKRDAAGHLRAKTSHTLNAVPCYVYVPAQRHAQPGRHGAKPGHRQYLGHDLSASRLR